MPAWVISGNFGDVPALGGIIVIIGLAMLGVEFKQVVEAMNFRVARNQKPASPERGGPQIDFGLGSERRVPTSGPGMRPSIKPSAAS